MVRLKISYVDELIAVRQNQHGGGRGAPRLNPDGSREGQVLNRAIIVMTSAALQAYCEEVFFKLSKRKLRLSAEQFEAYKKLYSQWGNPSRENLTRHFGRLGLQDVLEGLSWQRCATTSVRRNLDRLNNLRNQIAHGSPELRLDGQPYSLSLARARDYRNFAVQFGERFEAHARGLLNIPLRRRRRPGNQAA